MKITMTEAYETDCGGRCGTLKICDPHYCKSHRLLWKDCETAIATHDGAGQPWYELSDCPKCREEDRQRQYDRMMKEVKDYAAN